MKKWEIGWHKVKFANEEVMGLHWHQYYFNIPAGADLIASSEACAHQGFQYQNFIAGFQFHPEADAAWLKYALDEWNPERKGTVQSKEDVISDSGRFQPLMQKWYFKFLDQWFT